VFSFCDDNLEGLLGFKENLIYESSRGNLIGKLLNLMDPDVDV